MSKRRRKKTKAEQQGSEGWGIPADAIPADLAEQAPNNSYGPPHYYVAVEFVCRDCGKQEVWTAEDQKWYYEVAKGPIYATAVRCRACRKRRRAAQQGESGN